MKREERLLRLADLAESQWGLFTSAQAGDVGFTAQQLKRLADSELITRLRQGVYRLTGAPEDPEDPIRAEWLALDPGRLASERLGDDMPVGVVSHRSAALIQDLGDVDADRHEFTVAHRRGTRSPDVKFHVRDLAREDWRLVGGLPVTSPLRTVVDLAIARTDGGHLASIVRDAILTEDTTREELAAALRPYAHYYGFPIGAGESLVYDFIGQAGVPASAKALTRGDHGADLVLFDSENNRIMVQLKHFNTPRLNESFAQFRLSQELLPMVKNWSLNNPGLLSGEPSKLWALGADSSQPGAAYAESPSRTRKSAVDEDRGADDSDDEIPERPRVSGRDQRADQ